MKRVKEVAKVVEDVLTTYPETRNSDHFLYVRVCMRYNKAATQKPFWYVMSNLGELGLPPFETVRRTRQKVQADNPSLKAVEDVRNHRRLLEDEYREYALGREHK